MSCSVCECIGQFNPPLVLLFALDRCLYGGSCRACFEAAFNERTSGPTGIKHSERKGHHTRTPIGHDRTRSYTIGTRSGTIVQVRSCTIVGQRPGQAGLVLHIGHHEGARGGGQEDCRESTQGDGRLQAHRKPGGHGTTLRTRGRQDQLSPDDPGLSSSPIFSLCPMLLSGRGHSESPD